MDDSTSMDEDMAMQTAAWCAAQKQPLTFYRPGHFPSPATIHNTSTSSDNYNSSNQHGQPLTATELHESVISERGKQPCVQDHLSAPSMPAHGGLPTVPNFGDPGTSTALGIPQSQAIMPWQGDNWIMQSPLPSDTHLAISDPIPVRFPAALLTPELQSAKNVAGSEWILGLVIHSYMKSDRCELMYVILLNDGREVHLPSGEVDRIALLEEWKSSDMPIASTHNSQMLSVGGHPSSQEIEAGSESSFNSFYSTLLRSSDGGHTYDENEFNITSPLLCRNEGTSYAVGTPRNLQRSVFPTHTTTGSGSYARLFQDVLVDAVAHEGVVNYNDNATDIRSCQHGGPPSVHRDLPALRRSIRSAEPPHLVDPFATIQPLLPSVQGLEGTLSEGDQVVPSLVLADTVQQLPAFIVQNEVAVLAGCSSEKRPSGPLHVLTTHGNASCSSDQSAPPIDNTAAAPAADRPVRPPRPRRNGRLSAAAERRAFLEDFADERWTMNQSSFGTAPPQFSGPPAGPSFRMHQMPTKASLFGRFWTDRTLDRICIDTNRYASEMHPRRNVMLGGANWWRLDKVELKAFMAVNMLMGIKRLPNHRSYWNRSNEFLYCPSISSIMTSGRYEDITRCLHVADDSLPPTVGTDVEFDRLRKMRWLISELQQKFKFNWHLHQEVTVDETMIPYKGSYCPVRQYLPRKPTKWGVKVWCLADARQKYLYDFQIYTGSIFRQSLTGGTSRDAKTGEEVVMQLMEGLHGRAHMVCTDNYFTSVQLLQKLRSLGTYGVGTVRINRLGLPTSLLDLKTLSKEPQGSLLWRLHAGSDIAAVVFVDRKAVLMLSTFYPPVPCAGDLWPTVPRRIEGIVTNLETSPVHKGYCDFMRGVDVADHSRGSYSSQTRSHKWWHKIFFYLLDTSMVNCYILNKVALEHFGKDPVSHFHFQMQLADELSRPWSMQRGAVLQFRLSVPGVHGLVRSDRRRKCRFCRGPVRTNLLCSQCGGVFLHSGDCYQRSHYMLRR